MEVEMNWDQVAGNWKQLKGVAKEKWGRLTDDDLEMMAGQRDQLIGRLQEHYGMAREEAEKEADRWATSIKRPCGIQHLQPHPRTGEALLFPAPHPGVPPTSPTPFASPRAPPALFLHPHTHRYGNRVAA